MERNLWDTGDANLLNELHAVGFRLVLAVILDRIPRVLLEVDLDPNEHAGLRLADGCVTGGSDLGFEEIEQEVPPPLVLLREALYPVCKTAEAPAVLSQKLCEEELTESRGLLGRVVGELDEVPVEEGRAGDGSKTHSGGQNLREAVYPENTTVDVHGKEGGDERTGKRLEEALVGRDEVPGAIELEEVVRVWKRTGLEA